MPKDTVTFHMEEEKRVALDELAALLRRDRGELINEAVVTYVDFQRRQIGHIREGLAEADRGEFVSDEEIERILCKFRVSQQG